jgi:nucleotide-binding universal stress UspA family protein
MKKIYIRETEDRRFRLTEGELGYRWNAQEHGGPLQVFVPYASPELAQPALDAAAALAGSLGAQAVLVAVHVVSPLLPLDEPNVSREFLEKKLESVAEQSALPARVEIVFARERETGFRTVIPQGSLVLVPTRRRWWRTAEEKLARFLERAGHSVVLLTV